MQYYCTITHTKTHCSCSNIVTCDLNWTQRAFLTKNWGTKGREERTSPPLDCPLFWQRIESIVQYAAQQYTRVTAPQTDLHQTYSTGLHTQHDITASDRENTGTHPWFQMFSCLFDKGIEIYFQLSHLLLMTNVIKYCLLTPFTTKNVFP